jgi:UDP-GlcNAc:undecaprenyl-phosphate/decaprenyl-phosphate GlcNAc-1-phosphate transferase
MFATFLTTAIALWGGRRLALKFGFADRPGGRKQHDSPVPPIGGLAIIPVFLIFSHLAGLESIVPWPLAAGLMTLLIMGAIDDAKSIPSQIKFALIILVACFVVIFGGAEIHWLGNLFGFGDVGLGIGSKVFTVLALALLMNAINMMDGVDGLSGGFCALVAFWMMVVCSAAGDISAFSALGIMLAALLGFLLFNLRAPWRKSASVFMGDSGALSLGLLVGWFCIKLTQGANAPLEPATVIWIIAVPVMDAFALFLARSMRGLHPFNADRRHLHHRFQDAGFSPARTTGVILAMIAFFAMAGFVAQAENIPAYFLFYVWLAVFIAHTAGILKIVPRNPVNKT